MYLRKSLNTFDRQWIVDSMPVWVVFQTGKVDGIIVEEVEAEKNEDVQELHLSGIIHVHQCVNQRCLLINKILVGLEEEEETDFEATKHVDDFGGKDVGFLQAGTKPLGNAQVRARSIESAGR